MPITFSEHILDSHTQRDGSRWCREKFTLHTGRVVTHERHIPANAAPDQATFAAAKFVAHLADMPSTLARNELGEIVFGGLPFVLVEQTKAEFAARFWNMVLQLQSDSEGNAGARGLFEQAIWWVYQRVQAGDLTSDQVRLSFNAAFERSLTAGQWSSFITNRLLPIVNRYRASLDEVAL